MLQLATGTVSCSKKRKISNSTYSTSTVTATCVWLVWTRLYSKMCSWLWQFKFGFSNEHILLLASNVHNISTVGPLDKIQRDLFFLLQLWPHRDRLKVSGVPRSLWMTSSDQIKTSRGNESAATAAAQKFNNVHEKWRRRQSCRIHSAPKRSMMRGVWIAISWTSLDKGESLACQITSPFNKKLGSFCKSFFLFLFSKTTQLIVERGNYLVRQWLLYN